MSTPQISDAEWQAIKIIWAKSSCTAQEVIDQLVPLTNWSPKTIRTLLARLVKKGALGIDTSDRLYHYYPIVKEEECIKAKSRHFLDRIYGGSLKLMLARFIEQENLTREQMEELRRILDNKLRAEE